MVMLQSLNLDSLYRLRSNFIIIGLTGKTNSGCSTVTNQLVKGFNNGENFTNPREIYASSGGQFTRNAYRKHRIIYNFAADNFKPYEEIKYKDVITLFLLKHSIKDLIKFLELPYLTEILKQSSIEVFDYKNEIQKILELSKEFEHFSQILISIGNNNIQDSLTLYDLFFKNENFKDFSRRLHAVLGKNSDLLFGHNGKENLGIFYHKTFQVICNNIRKSGDAYNSTLIKADNVFTIVRCIDEIIKCHRKYNVNGITQIVINSLKNPLEIMFFKQSYSGFYCIAINKDEDTLYGELNSKFTTTNDKNVVHSVMDEEYKGDSDKKFFKQNVKECLQLADIYINFISKEDAEKLRETPIFTDKTTPDFSWNDQLLKYVSLIYHPGLVTPSSEERCMQVAFTAKYNSGCISRQVGAAITDENFSLKAIGWNDAPEGQVPCVLRSLQDLLNNEVDRIAFTNYETGEIGTDFREALKKHYTSQIKLNKEILNGRNICYCFKDIQNSIREGKNQVHTRSLHAEENAFLQISKYGGGGIKNGLLFTTASPCELCSKKAYQLGIKEIYYIDPYSSISKPQILSAGSRPIDMRLFNGAIGSAYHRLYNPMINYKDEINFLLDLNIIDLTTQYKKEIERLKLKIEKLESKKK